MITKEKMRWFIIKFSQLILQWNVDQFRVFVYKIIFSFHQAAWRGYLARSNLELQAFAVLRIQSSWRTFIARRDYLSVRDRIILLQSHARGYLARIRYVR